MSAHVRMPDQQEARIERSQGVKRKREEVMEPKRRTALACDTCRRQKEKCEGGPPCWRCTRLNRPCRFESPPTRARADARAEATTRQPRQSLQTASTDSDIVIHSADTSSGQSDKRSANLERIIRHFLGDVPMDDDNVEHIAEKVEKVEKASKESQSRSKLNNLDMATGGLNVNESFDVRFVSQNTAHYSGEFSHWNFSQKVRRRMNHHLEKFDSDVKDYWRPTQLQSPVYVIFEATSQLPPRPITDFLVGLFFKYVQLNCFYIGEGWIKEKLDICYSQVTDFAASDVSWVCAIFTVLAIGTQVAHMEADRAEVTSDTPEDLNLCSEDAVGVVFYHVACKLIPDVITIASHESVQAFLLLATYTLPLSTGGLAYTYLGLAIKMAVLNGMHRKYVGSDCDDKIIESRNRLFWTAYTLEKRVSVMHGRPGSIARPEINADLPTDFSAFESPNFANMMAFIKLNSWLGEVADTLTLFGKCPRRLVPEYSERIMRLRESIKQWWTSLPEKTECRDSSPRRPLFRQNAHLKLCYLLIYIYLGRPFMFYEDRKGPAENSQSSAHHDASCDSHEGPRSVLVDDCVQSALEILETLQSLSDHTGLCRASYTEFSSCRAALLVIVAESLNSPRSKMLRNALTRGMILIRQMTGGSSSESEISLIESLETAIKQLSSLQEDNDAEDGSPSEQGLTSAYAKFKSWTQMLKKSSSTGNLMEIASFSPRSHLTAGPENFRHAETRDSIELFSPSFGLLNPNWSNGSDVGLDPSLFELPHDS